VDRFEFVFALIVITLLATVITFLFYLSGKRSVACYLFFSFNFGMLIHVFFPHLAATIALRRYCPGLLTGILILAPTTIYLLLYGCGNGYFLFPTSWFVTIPFAAVVVGSIPFLFKFGKYLQNRFGVNQSSAAVP
jgi:hypothetical protein